MVEETSDEDAPVAAAAAGWPLFTDTDTPGDSSVLEPTWNVTDDDVDDDVFVTSLCNNNNSHVTPGQLSLLSLWGRQIEYQPVWRKPEQLRFIIQSRY